MYNDMNAMLFTTPYPYNMKLDGIVSSSGSLGITDMRTGNHVRLEPRNMDIDYRHDATIVHGVYPHYYIDENKYYDTYPSTQVHPEYTPLTTIAFEQFTKADAEHHNKFLSDEVARLTEKCAKLEEENSKLLTIKERLLAVIGRAQLLLEDIF